MKPISKAELKRQENEIKDYVCSTVVDQLNKSFKRSKFNPTGGFRQGWGYIFKVYGLMDIVTVNARYYGVNMNNQAEGRLMINSADNYSIESEKRSNKIIKSLDNKIIEDIKLNFEIDCANGHSLWFAWSIQ